MTEPETNKNKKSGSGTENKLLPLAQYPKDVQKRCLSLRNKSVI